MSYTSVAEGCAGRVPGVENSGKCIKEKGKVSREGCSWLFLGELPQRWHHFPEGGDKLR